ncbi:MAG: hypothetical protein WCO25_03005 [Candidatus Uhrbacteria bacterium]
MPDAAPINKVSKVVVANMFAMVIVHIAGAALGIYALMVLAGDALPGWQVAVLERSMFFVPLFVLFEQVGFVAKGAFPRTTGGVIGSVIPMVATVAFSYWHFGNWLNVALDLSMPMLGITGLVWLVAGVGFPIFAFIEEPGFAAIGLGLFFLAMYSFFIIPAVGVLISLFTYAGSMIFANGVTSMAVLLLLSMVGIILSEGYRYATALGAFGDDE